jgi:predicted nucleic acid-binding protein
MVLIDAGPLVALFDISEPHHKRCNDILAKFHQPLATTWPVLTEAFHLLRRWEVGQDELWDFIVSGGVHVLEIPESLHPRMLELMKKYSDNPMDLADASLVAVAEYHKINRIFTLDRRDFSRYRPKHCAHFTVVP